MDSSSNSSLDSTSPDSGRLISSTVLGLCCALGLPGNIAVLVVILRRTSRRPNFTLCLMLNLASSDILCLATVPVWIYTLGQGWTLGRAACKLATFLLYLSLYANVLTVTLLGVQRYLQVLYPQMWNRLGRKGEAVLLLALWGLACALTAPAVATRDVRDGELKCQRHTVAVLVLEIVLWFVVPFSVLVTSYCRLHRRVNQTALFSSAKMTRLVISVVVTFFILWIPVNIVKVLAIARIVLQTSPPEVSDALRRHGNAAARVALCFMVFNSCLDPFLYAFASRRIREQPKSSSRGENRMQVTNI
uniref:Leukotriene B4 receptor 1-like n=1 Tax=Oncorhynchus kisutch TaxID=8019 RepID=A0A8C7MBZ4_ONCKI